MKKDSSKPPRGTRGGIGTILKTLRQSGNPNFQKRHPSYTSRNRKTKIAILMFFGTRNLLVPF